MFLTFTCWTNQNQRLSNIFQGLISQQLAANDTDNQPKDSKNMPRGENKRKRAATVEDDETEARPAKRTRSAPPSYSSTKAPSTTKAHEDGAAKPILIAEGREYDPARDRDHYIVKDRLIDFLYDVPGWGPNRAVTPLSESYFYIDDEFYNDDEDLMFTMDDLFDFDRYDAP